MSPELDMMDLLSSTPNSNTLSIPKLHDNGSNLANYKPQVRKAMGAKGLWRHVEGTAITLKQYNQVSGVYVLADSKTPASEEKVEA
jgi:hypothetical protein